MTARRPAGAPPATYSDTAHRAITSELGRLVLGGRGPERPELALRLTAAALDDLAAGLTRLGRAARRYAATQGRSDAHRHAARLRAAGLLDTPTDRRRTP